MVYVFFRLVYHNLSYQKFDFVIMDLSYTSTRIHRKNKRKAWKEAVGRVFVDLGSILTCIAYIMKVFLLAIKNLPVMRRSSASL